MHYPKMFEEDYNKLVEDIKSKEIKTKKDVLEYLDENVGVYRDEDYIPVKYVRSWADTLRFRKDIEEAQKASEIYNDIIRKWYMTLDLERKLKEVE